MNKTESIDYKIGELSVIGLSQKEIAEKVGVSQPTVSRVLSKDNIREYRDRLEIQFIDKSAEKALENISGVVEDYSKPVRCDDKGRYDKYELMRREHGYDASKELARKLSVLESRSQQVVNNIFNQQNNNTQFISPLVAKALGLAMTSIDAEVIEDPAE